MRHVLCSPRLRPSSCTGGAAPARFQAASASVLWLPPWHSARNSTHPHKPVLWLKLLGHLHVVIDQAEAGALAAAKLGPHAKHKDAVQVLDVVHLGQLLAQLGLQETQSAKRGGAARMAIRPGWPSALPISTACRCRTGHGMIVCQLPQPPAACGRLHMPRTWRRRAGGRRHRGSRMRPAIRRTLLTLARPG